MFKPLTNKTLGQSLNITFRKRSDSCLLQECCLLISLYCNLLFKGYMLLVSILESSFSVSVYSR